MQILKKKRKTVDNNSSHNYPVKLRFYISAKKLSRKNMKFGKAYSFKKNFFKKKFLILDNPIKKVDLLQKRCITQ